VKDSWKSSFPPDTQASPPAQEPLNLDEIDRWPRGRLYALAVKFRQSREGKALADQAQDAF